LGKNAVNVGLEGADDIRNILFAALHIAAGIALHPFVTYLFRQCLHLELINFIANRGRTSIRTHHRRISDLYFPIQ
jgi:hypothetical protein